MKFGVVVKVRMALVLLLIFSLMNSGESLITTSLYAHIKYPHIKYLFFNQLTCILTFSANQKSACQSLCVVIFADIRLAYMSLEGGA